MFMCQHFHEPLPPTIIGLVRVWGCCSLAYTNSTFSPCSFTHTFLKLPCTIMAADSLSTAITKLRSLGQGTVHYDPDYAAGIGLITLNNPERQNAFSGKMMVEFYEIVVKLEQQNPKDTVAIIVTGSPGKAFCAGLDLSFAQEHLRAPGMAAHVNHLMHDALSRFARLPYITVASMAGPALGGGTELITAFDYVCIASTAFVRFVQTRMGITSPWGGARRLVNSIGRKKALWILGSAPKVDAAMAKELGLADVIVNSTTTARGADTYDACLKASTAFLRGFTFDDRTNERVTPGAVRGMKKLVIRADLDQDEAYEASVLAELAGLSKI
ncbi:ClpP/crotonase-like domain-containing protein [Zychaea mexicana]|uniref:ClpP/crotonase-like domain-containing protein n=1 Tax=Zychaea mexicana TaxID=64656 RepID=UPI0022FE5B16|nr:ClpP/crotonase-like domain-containing protein [Zychaea mexicana]KAI9489064.1 ClpP/crotonase-like domain-containing protein [Zychaea mexicana]